jgi:hypothetical protein
VRLAAFQILSGRILMPPTKRQTTARNTAKRGASNGAPLGFEEKLWAAADKMRGHMDAGPRGRAGGV